MNVRKLLAGRLAILALVMIGFVSLYLYAPPMEIIHWPELPASRRAAAERAAGHCTLHHTLEHPPRVTTTVTLTPSREAEAEMAGARSPAPQG